ncbi:hypothetical protein ACQP00_51615 [Dactylosporangium sp. CS-047395]|jgi:signal transduction histidine kinase|uniref:hypothetical protein n=1 Tax=Dactylosporangium sp. CS-047395 TaxID=3239936 RepID=UPI003D91F5DD
MSEEELRATVATATHDLSNVLGAVLNYTTFLAEDLAGSGGAPEYLPHLQSAAERALTLVTGLAAALAGDAERD